MAKSLDLGPSFLLWTPINTSTLKLDANYTSVNTSGHFEITLHGCASNNEGLYYCVVFAAINREFN